MTAPTQHEQPWDERTAHWYASQYGDWPTTWMPIEAERWRAEESVLDIGCGTGSSLRHLLAHCPDGRLVGIEPSAAMLAIARRQTRQAGLAERIEFHCSPVEVLPLADASMDSVLAFSSYHHWQDVALGLGEVYRVLKPGGRLLLSEEPEVLERAGLNLEGIQQQLLAAGFDLQSLRRLAHGEALCALILARKPAPRI
ncbi:class I SAM-dependent methyltransferase [Pseudomonas sp. MBLB4123]|uniref:class I SAM-dependent methyltransferase n=1 Tax=Pseudomonas sp. MBLB4123 TaxID=3451557 RepID=UPI003F755DEF